MSNARNLANLLESDGDIKVAALDNAPAPTKSTIDALGIAATSLTGSQATAITNNATTAGAALPKAGGALTGAVTTNSTFDGVDIATRDGVLTSTTATAAAALPKAGGTMTGDTFHGDNVAARFGAGNDLSINHTGSYSSIVDSGTGDLWIAADANVNISNAALNEYKAQFISNGAVNLYYDNAAKLATTATGIDVTGLSIGGTAIPNFHRSTSLAGSNVWTTDFKQVFDDNFMIQCSLTGTNNSSTTVVHTFPTAYTSCMGTSVSILDNGDREGYAHTKGSAGNTSVTVHYRMGDHAGSVGTAYVMVYSWGTVS